MNDMVDTPIMLGDTVVSMNEATNNVGLALGSVSAMRKGKVYIDSKPYDPSKILVIELPVVLEGGVRMR